MGRIASEMSDRVILTSDNPRSEDPLSIISDMRAGVSSPHEAPQYFEIPDRRKAIQFACSLYHSETLILVAGKGHEKYQEINGEKIHFDDFEILTNFLAEQQTACSPDSDA